jgi:hypothetical protein
MRQETGRKHGSVVAEEEVAGAQEVRQIAEGLVRHAVGLTIDHKQARAIAPR